MDFGGKIAKTDGKRAIWCKLCSANTAIRFGKPPVSPRANSGGRALISLITILLIARSKSRIFTPASRRNTRCRAYSGGSSTDNAARALSNFLSLNKPVAPSSVRICGRRCKQDSFSDTVLCAAANSLTILSAASPVKISGVPPRPSRSSIPLPASRGHLSNSASQGLQKPTSRRRPSIELATTGFSVPHPYRKRGGQFGTLET